MTSIQQGKTIARVLSTRSPSEIAVFGATYINVSPEDYLAAMHNLDRLRKSPHFLAIRQFSTPPKLSDLEGFTLDDDDLKDLKKCKPGKCELQLPAESIEEVQNLVNWSGPNVAAQVNKLAQQMALELLIKYQKEGNGALGTYRDKEQPLSVIEQFESLVHHSSSFSRYLPDLKNYLIGYPQAQLPNAENFFLWEKVKFGLKPTLRINHVIIYRNPGASGPTNSITVKQLYASHYFQNALDVSMCVKDNIQPQENGFYLITVKGSCQAGLTGPKGAIIRKIATSRVRSSLESSLTHIKSVLESGRADVVNE